MISSAMTCEVVRYWYRIGIVSKLKI